jgi:hypothetical protein
LDVRPAASDPWLARSGQIQPSESIGTIRCQLWHAHHAQACPDSPALAAEYFPNITQTAKTLYIPWPRCYFWEWGWGGINVEYQPSRRTVVIHCYSAAPLIRWFHGPPGIGPTREQVLLVVSTKSLSAGLVTIVEDIRIEHLVGDESTEFRWATATIS